MTGTSLIANMASRYDMDPVVFARTLRATAMPSKHTEEQFAAFLMVAKQYGLNPLTREIYAFPNPKTGGVVPVVSIDGWINLVNSHPACDGYEFAFETDDGKADGKLESATCIMWRKDRGHPVVVTEYFSECYRNTDPWNGMPRRMLRHKSLIQCARYAFGFAGIHDEDEARDIVRAVERIETVIPSNEVEKINTTLDEFAAGEVETAVAAEPSSAGSDQTAASEQSPPTSSEAAVDNLFADQGTPSDDPRPDIIQRLFLIATSKEPLDDRLTGLEVVHVDQIDIHPNLEPFIRDAVKTAAKVAKGELTAIAGRKHVEAML